MSNTALSNYNPDVLSCLANLSNDEVFTPPQLANQMLDMLPQELFKSPDTRFLDPCAKSGVFLREIAKRLIDGLADEMPDLQKRIDHIMHHQLYGLSITQLTALMSRRSLYCSKDASCKYSLTHFDDPIPARIIGKAEFGEKNMICSETFLAIGPFTKKDEAVNVASYMQTKFFRLLVGIRKNKNMTQKTYSYVPLQDFSKPWTDAELYAKYGLTDEEIQFIESMIRPME